MNPTKVAIIVIVLVVIAGAAYLFTTQNPTSKNSESNESMMEETIEETSEMVDDADTDIVTIDMTGENFRFSEDEISVQAGQTVRVVLTANDMQHDFVIDELDVKSDIAATGETVEVEFTPTEAGEYEFYCSVGQHRANGMVGTLTVTE